MPRTMLFCTSASPSPGAMSELGVPAGELDASGAHVVGGNG
ncbi:hypothetical protein ACFOOM_23120 [Streptomyces echinoruber]|nr:hypothetical protein [Streptomyces echinoruber]